MTSRCHNLMTSFLLLGSFSSTMLVVASATYEIHSPQVLSRYFQIQISKVSGISPNRASLNWSYNSHMNHGDINVCKYFLLCLDILTAVVKINIRYMLHTHSDHHQ